MLLKTFDSINYRGKKHFEKDGTQNYLVFQPLKIYFKVNANTKYISLWKSKGLSDENIIAPTTSDYKLRGSCLEQDKITFNHGKIANIYIVYELDKLYSNTAPSLVNCLFGAVSLTKNADIDMYKYSGYGIGFERRATVYYLAVILVEM